MNCRTAADIRLVASSVPLGTCAQERSSPRSPHPADGASTARARRCRALPIDGSAVWAEQVRPNRSCGARTITGRMVPWTAARMPARSSETSCKSSEGSASASSLASTHHAALARRDVSAPGAVARVQGHRAVGLILAERIRDRGVPRHHLVGLRDERCARFVEIEEGLDLSGVERISEATVELFGLELVTIRSG
jgi:hypothetical protein